MSEPKGSEPRPDDSAVERLRCSCSVTGFEDPLWVSTYYPPECPQDWRVAYFCNDFHSVYLPAVDWVGNAALLNIMLEELEPDFDLVLEWPVDLSPAQHQELCEQLEPLQNNIACVVINSAALTLADLRAMLQILSPYFVLNIMPSTDPDRVSLAQEFSAATVWSPQQGPLVATNCRYQVVLLPCLGLREMTPVLKQLDQILSGDQRGGVFLASAPHSAQRALEIRTVIELMGL